MNPVIAMLIGVVVMMVLVICTIAVFKIKAHIRRSGTSRNNQR